MNIKVIRINKTRNLISGKNLVIMVVLLCIAAYSCKKNSNSDTPFIKLQVETDATWMVGNDGGGKSFCVETNRAITSEHPDWIEVSSELHPATTHVTLIATANNSQNDRTGTVTLSTEPIDSDEKKLSITIAVHQSVTNSNSGGAHH